MKDLGRVTAIGALRPRPLTIMATKRRAQPDLAIHPGEILAEELEARTMTQVELARRMGRPVQVINEIINGKKAITAETALELEKALGVPAHVWVNLQGQYELTQARLVRRSAPARLLAGRGPGPRIEARHALWSHAWAKKAKKK